MKVPEQKQFEEINVFGTGKPNDAFARYFVGKSFLNPLTNPQETAVFLANVTFEPGCRNNWHIQSRQKRRRSDSPLHGGRGLVSGGKQTARFPHRRNGYHDSGRGEALARCEKGQLLLTHRRRGPGRGRVE